MIIINYNFRFAEKVLLRKGMLILIWKFILEKKTIDALIVERDLHKKEISKPMLDQFIRKKNRSPVESAESHFPKRVTCKHTYGHITKMIDFHAVCAVKHFLKKVLVKFKTFYFMIWSIWFVIYVYIGNLKTHMQRHAGTLPARRYGQTRRQGGQRLAQEGQRLVQEHSSPGTSYSIMLADECNFKNSSECHTPVNVYQHHHHQV